LLLFAYRMLSGLTSVYAHTYYRSSDEDRRPSNPMTSVKEERGGRAVRSSLSTTIFLPFPTMAGPHVWGDFISMP
jgi:hypothetical protein